MVEFAPGPGGQVWSEWMSERGSGATEAVVPFAPKSVARSDPNDPLERRAI